MASARQHNIYSCIHKCDTQDVPVLYTPGSTRMIPWINTVTVHMNHDI